MSNKTVKWKDIVSNSKTIKAYVEKNQKGKNINGLNAGETLYVLARAVKYPGKDVTIPGQLVTCKDCTGTGIYHNFTKTEYLKVTDKILNWFKTNVKAPNYISWGSEKISVRLAIFAFSKIIVWYANNGNKLPKTCWFANAVFYTQQSTITGFTKKLSQATGVNITDYKTLYKAMYQFRYDYYYEDHQTNSETLRKMKGNCVDLNQVEYYSLKEMYPKEQIQIVRGVVQCTDGQYGHVWCRIKINGSWVNLDASASAKGKPIGTVICSSVIAITSINPNWAVNDTGDA